MPTGSEQRRHHAFSGNCLGTRTSLNALGVSAFWDVDSDGPKKASIMWSLGRSNFWGAHLPAYCTASIGIPAQTTELIGIWTWVDSKNHVFSETVLGRPLPAMWPFVGVLFWPLFARSGVRSAGILLHLLRGIPRVLSESGRVADFWWGWPLVLSAVPVLPRLLRTEQRTSLVLLKPL